MEIIGCSIQNLLVDNKKYFDINKIGFVTGSQADNYNLFQHFRSKVLAQMKRSLASTSTVPLKLNKDLVFQVFKLSFLQVTVSGRGKNFSIFFATYC